jgi:hypothetical protein
MRIFFTIFSFLLFGLLSIHVIAQEAGEIRAHELIEIEATEGKILLFPSHLQGPDGPIIKFVMFGVYAAPEVVIDTMTESIYPHITTIHFIEGQRFSGWFDVPQEKIVSIWINSWFIPWVDM